MTNYLQEHTYKQFLKIRENGDSPLVLQKFTTVRKAATFFYILKAFFSYDTHQSMKTSDTDLMVNRNIYPDAINVIGCV